MRVKRWPMQSRQRAVCSLLTLVLAMGLAVPAQQKPEQLAEQSAKSWLARVDSGNYGESWVQAATLFKAAVTSEQWQSRLRATRDPLGKMLSRKLMSAYYTKTLPGAPDGEYVVIQYDSSFEHKQAAVETVTPTLDKESGGFPGITSNSRVGLVQRSRRVHLRLPLPLHATRRHTGQEGRTPSRLAPSLTSIDRSRRISVVLRYNFSVPFQVSRTLHEGSCNPVAGRVYVERLRQRQRGFDLLERHMGSGDGRGSKDVLRV